MNTEDTNWWLPIFKGTIRKDSSKECSDYVGLCMDYYDGGRSAMLRFATGEEVKLKRLAVEVCATHVEADLVKERDLPKFAAFERWLDRHATLARAALALQDAKQGFDAAIIGMGLQDNAYAEHTLLQRCLVKSPHLGGAEGAGDDWLDADEPK